VDTVCGGVGKLWRKSVMHNISVVIPCYNSDQTIGTVVDEIVQVVDGKYDYEIVLVNDGSTVALWKEIGRLAEKYSPHVKGIRFAKNFGQHAATMAGYRESKGDIVIQMDDDGQSDAHGIPKLIEKMDEGYDVVFARYPDFKESWFRRAGSEFNRRMCISLLGMPRDIKPTSFCAIRRFVVDEMVRYEKPYPYIAGLMYRATTNMCDVEIEHRERAEGKSNYTLKKLIKLWLNGFTAFSVKPLRVATVMGMVFAFIGFIYALFIIIRRLAGVPVMTGWSSLISIILILGGLNMVMLGMVGEYIGRIYICLNNSPQYVIRDKIGDKEDES
jgi:undecaprenyl-phosphate 4-deoxy-4-formamido-L-arabinose transferase